MKKDNWFSPLLAMVFIMVLVLWASIAFAMDVTLQWDASEQPDVTSHRIYYDIDSGHPYNGTGAVEGDSGVEFLLTADENPDPAIVEHTLTGLSNDTVFFFAVKAVDDLGLSSAYSNEVNTEGPDAPEIRFKEIIFSQTQTQKITLRVGN